MAVKVIVEMRAKPGRRDELLRLIEGIIAEHGPNMPGSLGATLYKAVDDSDMLVEIADWESVAAREAVMKEAEASGAFAPMFDLLIRSAPSHHRRAAGLIADSPLKAVLSGRLTSGDSRPAPRRRKPRRFNRPSS